MHFTWTGPTPHMHTECNPDSYDEDKKGLLVTIKSSFHAKNIRLFTKDFQHMKKFLVRDIVVYMMIIEEGKGV